MILVSTLFGCSNSNTDNTSPATEGEYLDLPQGATLESYTDMPGFEKVSGKDSQDRLVFEGTYVKGKRQGAWVEHHSNGMVQSITNYHEGIKQGSFVTIDDRGRLLERGFYLNGQLHGSYNKFKFTRVIEDKFYQNGKLEGTVKKYYDNGKILEESNYTSGQLNGKSTWYDQEGNVSIEYEYANGQRITQ